MSDWYSLDDVADRLGLHVRTVRSYVREGRLGAVRIGKQYRVSDADLRALTGVSSRSSGPRRVEATSVLDVDGIDSEAAERLVALVRGLPKGPRAPHVDVVHESDRLKVIVVGSVEANAELLRFVGAMAEEAV
jgi:excisionase family DNA binding protein